MFIFGFYGCFNLVLYVFGLNKKTKMQKLVNNLYNFCHLGFMLGFNLVYIICFIRDFNLVYYLFTFNSGL